MQLNELKRQTTNRRKKTVGRGGKRGTTAGRGTKGQRARAGHRIRPEIRDTIKKLPKLRGYRFAPQTPYSQVVSLATLAKHFSNGDLVSPQTLAAKSLIKRASARVKILGGVEAKLPKLVVERCAASASAKSAIIAAGGAFK